MNRRLVLSMGIVAPLAAVVPLPAISGPDVAIVAALTRSRELIAAIADLPEWDEETADRLSDELADCHAMIAETPCSAVGGVAAKLHLLMWAHDNGAVGDWEGRLIHTALEALARISPEARL